MPTVALRERCSKLGWVSPKSKYEKAKGKIPLVPTKSMRFYSNRFQLIDSDNSGTKRYGIDYISPRNAAAMKQGLVMGVLVEPLPELAGPK